MFKAIKAKNFPNLEGEMDIQIQKAQRMLNRLKINKATHIKFSKVSQKFLKAAGQNRQVTYKETC